jgi:hypothetical protein
MTILLTIVDCFVIMSRIWKDSIID